MPGEVAENPPIPAVERMGSMMAARTVRGGPGRGYRDSNPTLKLFDRVQPRTGGVGKDGLQMARGRSHLPLNDRTFLPCHVLGHLGRPKRARNSRVFRACITPSSQTRPLSALHPVWLGCQQMSIVGEQDVNQVNENVDSELASAGSAEIRAVLER